jgi:benzylsuccinate CoA-transferase BbsE subunit
MLTGITVLDLADEKADFASKILADMGARVIKVEPPGGTPARQIGPFWQGKPHPERSMSFFYHNTGKDGITLNPEQREGRETFLRLVEHADAVIETYSPGYLDGIDLGFKDLAKVNPGIILVSVTGFGRSGPKKDYRSCDLVASASGGQMHVTGLPGEVPLKMYGTQSYYTSSLYSAIAVLLALRKRGQDGKGEWIDISLQESVASTLDHVLPRYFYENIIAKRQGSLHWNNAFCILPCKDGFIHITLFQQWDILVEWLKKDAMADDLAGPEWENEEYRRKHYAHIIEVLGNWTKKHSVEELVEIGQLMRFPWAPVHSPGEVLASPHLEERGFFRQVEHPEIKTNVRFPGLPFKYSAFPLFPERPAPMIGQDNESIFMNELGLTREEMTSLTETNKFEVSNSPF